MHYRILQRVIRILATMLCIGSVPTVAAYYVDFVIKNPYTINNYYIKKININVHCEPNFPSIHLNMIPQDKKTSSSKLMPLTTTTRINVGNPCYNRYWTVLFAEISISDNKYTTHHCGKVLKGYNKIGKQYNTCTIQLLYEKHDYCKATCQ